MNSPNKFKYLIGRPSPRDIPEVIYEKLDCDVVLAKYYQHWQAMQEIRNFFLKNKTYDYLIIAPDDLVVKQRHVDQLVKDLETVDYRVLSGICNVDEADHGNVHGLINISYELPSKQKPRHYNFLTRSKISGEPYIFDVKFSGFPLMAIRRDLVEKYEFPSDSVFKGNRPQEGYSFDLVFCYWCDENKIPVHVDRRIYMQHKRISGESYVGKREPRTVFIAGSTSSS